MSANDKAEIIEALNLYAFALDARQWDLFDRIFTDDIALDLGPASVAWSNLAEFKQGFRNFHETLDNHQHTMMGHLVHVDGDTAYAFSYGNWLLVREAAEGGPAWLGTGWYDDELARIDGNWKIKRRVCRLLSWTGNPKVPEPNGDQEPDMNMNSLFQACEAGEVGYFKAIGPGISSGGQAARDPDPLSASNIDPVARRNRAAVRTMAGMGV